MGNSKKLSLAIAGLILGASLVACDDGRGGAESAAKQFASALSTLDVGSVAFDGKDSGVAKQQVQDVFKALEPDKPTVSAGELTLDGDTATVPLDYTWKIGTGEWKYTVSAEFTKSGDNWRAVWNPAALVPGLADNEILSKGTQSPQRADILGADDAKLVTYRPVVNVGIDRLLLGSADAAASATKLAELVGVDPAAYAQQVAASGAEAFVRAITLRDEGRTVTDAQITAIPGARAIPEAQPLAPSRTFARAVLGTVGEATAEQIEASDGVLTAGDVTGIGGLQQQYDAQLRGTDAVVIRAQRADLTREQIQAAGTDPRRVVFQAAPTPGTPLKTTLDPNLQSLAESTLAGVGPASAIVALRPSTGAVLAAASGPGSNGYNTAMLGQYAPGSTFKIVDSLAMLRNGLTPDSKVECTPTLTVDGRTFKNAEGYPETSLGSVALRDAFAHSCNTAFIAARDTVTQAQLEAAAVAMGVAVEAPRAGRRGVPGVRSGRGCGHRTCRLDDRPGQGAPVPAGCGHHGRFRGQGIPRLTAAGPEPRRRGCRGRHLRRDDGGGRVAVVDRYARGTGQGVRPAHYCRGGRGTVRHDAGGRHVRPRGLPDDSSGRAGGRQDRHGGVRQGEPAQDARLDCGRPR